MTNTKEQVRRVTTSLPAWELKTIKRAMLDAGEDNVSDANALSWAAKQFIQMSKGRAARTAR